MKPRVYLDVCSLERPLDAPDQERVRLESEAVKRVLLWHSEGRLSWIGSIVVETEIQDNPNYDDREMLLETLEDADERVGLSEDMRCRANHLAKFGFRAADAHHIAAAELGRCSVLLTTDDKMLRIARRYAAQLKVRVVNPVDWVNEVQSK